MGANGERNKEPFHTIDSNIFCTRAFRTKIGRGGPIHAGVGAGVAME